MLTITTGLTTIHSDLMQGDAYTAINPILTEEKGKVPALSFQIAPNNAAYAAIKNGDLVTAEEDDTVIFHGRVDKITQDFRKVKKVDCVGEFTFMLDTVIRPFEAFTGTVQQMLEALVTSHNVCADEDKQFTVGTVANPGSFEFVNSGYSSTMAYIQEHILGDIGGSIYFDGPVTARKINYRYAPDASTQLIMYGQNLLDMTNAVDYTDLYTVLLPVGKDGLTIASITGGSDFLANEEAVNLYGRRWRVETFDDIEDPQELFDRGMGVLAQGAVITPSMTLRAFDLANLGVGIERFEVAQMVAIYSEPHGIDMTLEVQKITRNLLNPSGSSIMVGDPRKGLSSRVQKAESRIEREAQSGIGYPVKRTDLAIDVQNSLNMFDLLGLSVVNGKVYDTWEEE